MSDSPVPPRFTRSAELEPYELKKSFSWGKFVRYIEFAADRFAIRQVDVYLNGNAVAYDREHWEDRFGCLADFRFGHNWVRHWGTPMEVAPDEFAAHWSRAEAMRASLGAPRTSSGPPLWIRAFECGGWKGQT